MATSLSPEQVSVIKATVPVVAEHGNTITTKFYHDMIEAHPELRNIFNNTHQATGHQPRALAGALYAYAANIDALGNLSSALELICHKHVSLYIKPEQYDIVGTHLLQTMQTVLGAAATPEILGAWEAAYWQLAHIMIQKEEALYQSAGAWNDWKDFKISRKEKEAADITSFYLTPVDSSLKLPVFKPGQYVSVTVFVDELDGGVWQARQYSLSDTPGKPYLRISVKREEGLEIGDDKSKTHPGYLSNILHEQKNVGDVVKVSHPFGDFFLEDVDGHEKEKANDTPVVLISAGVGLTCLTSILNTLAEGKSERPISWIHGAKHEGLRPFKQHINKLVASNKNIRTFYFSSAPKEHEVKGKDYDIQGRIDLDKLSKDDLFINDPKTQYFICGPTQFMLNVQAKLKTYGVTSERVKTELFGTGGVPQV